jgi:hypothetical protein
MASYIKKDDVDMEPDITLVNIHDTWTPLGQQPDWEVHRETRRRQR